MSGVLYLCNVLQFVIDRFDQRFDPLQLTCPRIYLSKECIHSQWIMVKHHPENGW